MDTDRNLLFGVLALQAELIDTVQFAEACTAWTMRKNVQLSDLLVERGWLSETDRSLINHLIERKLERYGGDVQDSLAAAANHEVQRVLAVLNDSEVQRTLAHLSRPAGHVLVSTVSHLPDTRERYTLTRLHAQGGIGQVWLARDSSLGREVALKELRPERAANPALWSRFLQEAKITGQLEHPGIVPVYELARRERDEQPFYTMRFVRGRTLSEAIRAFHENRVAGQAGPLDQRTLLNAFVGVCNAVAYAHARGVVHRDLKSSNVVLGDYGEVVVLDWGLAKIVGGADQYADTPPIVLDPDCAPENTVAGQVLGTPAYMAPEQAAGRLDLVDHRSDIYGLGAILYELLVGQPPFTGADSQEVLRKVCSEGPRPPRQMLGGVAPALEAISLRALAKNRADRFATAGELAADVQRWLADEPVKTYREPFPVRLGRWTRRHKAWVASAAALLLMGTIASSVGAILISQEKERAEAARTRAEENFQLARDAVDRYYTQVSESKLLNVPRLQPLRKELLESAGQFYEEFVKKRSDDPTVRSDLGNAYLRIASITSDIGSKRRAIDVGQKALAVYGQLAEERKDEPAYLRGLARTHTSLGTWYQATSQVDLAKQALLQASALQEQLVKIHPADAQYQSDLAVTQSYLGSLYRKVRQMDQAEASYQRAREITERLVRDYPLVPRHHHELAINCLNLGYIYFETQRASQVEAVFEQARTIETALTNAHPDVSEYQRQLAAIQNDLGFFFSVAQQAAKAESAYHAALAIYERLTRDYPEVTDYQNQRAKTYLNLTTLFGSMGKRAEELAACQQALAIYQHLAQVHPDVPDYQNEWAKCFNNLAVIYHLANQAEQAEDSYQQALEIWKPLAAAYPAVADYQRLVATAQFNLGLLYRDTNRTEQGETFLKDALAIRQQRAGDATTESLRDLVSSQLELGLLYARSRKDSAAEQCFRQAREVAERLVRENPTFPDCERDLAVICSNLAQLHSDAGQFEKAEPCAREALTVQEKLVRDHPTVPEYRSHLAQTRHMMAGMYQRLCQTEQAETACKEAIALQEQLNAEHPQTTEYSVNLGASYVQAADLAESTGKLEEAIEWTDRAVARLDGIIAEQARNVQARQTLAQAYATKAQTLSKLGRHGEALENSDHALAVGVEQLAARLRLGRAAIWARQGDHARCVAEARAVEQDHASKPNVSGAIDDLSYQLAWVYALAASAVKQAQQLSQAEQEKLAEQYGARAVALLNEAAQHGLLKVPANARRLTSDPDFASLRAHDGFQKLLHEL